MNETTEKTDLNGISIEEAFRRLDTLLARMREEDSSLEENFTLYQQGLTLVRMLNERIDGYEKQLEILENGAGEG